MRNLYEDKYIEIELCFIESVSSEKELIGFCPISTRKEVTVIGAASEKFVRRCW